MSIFNLLRLLVLMADVDGAIKGFREADASSMLDLMGSAQQYRTTALVDGGGYC